MVSTVSNSNALHNAQLQQKMKTPTANGAETGEAKKYSAPGQAAKLAIDSSERTDLPNNINGKVASALARGLDFESMLTLQKVSSPDQVESAVEYFDLAADDTDDEVGQVEPDAPS